MARLSKNFSREEFACKCGCGFDTVDIELIGVLESVRAEFKAPILVTSGCRCLKYNQSVSGAADSQHTKGRAADIVVSGVSAPSVYAFLCIAYPSKFGFGRYDGFTHVDTRTNNARWNG